MKPEIPLSTGERMGLFDPDPAALTAEVIAHSLSMQCRFTGHCREFYSVAQHSVLVADAIGTGCPPPLRLAALLHDAGEVLVGDVASPLKHQLGRPLQDIEAQAQMAVAEAFDLGSAWSNPFQHRDVKHADLRLLHTEFRDLFPQTDFVREICDGLADTPPLPDIITPLPPAAAKAVFLRQLRGLVDDGVWLDLPNHQSLWAVWALGQSPRAVSRDEFEKLEAEIATKNARIAALEESRSEHERACSVMHYLYCAAKYNVESSYFMYLPPLFGLEYLHNLRAHIAEHYAGIFTVNERRAIGGMGLEIHRNVLDPTS